MSELRQRMIDAMVLAGFAALGIILLPSTPEILSLRNIAIGIVLFQTLTLAFFVSSWPSLRWFERARSLGLFRTHRAAAGGVR